MERGRFSLLWTTLVAQATRRREPGLLLVSLRCRQGLKHLTRQVTEVRDLRAVPLSLPISRALSLSLCQDRAALSFSSIPSNSTVGGITRSTGYVHYNACALTSTTWRFHLTRNWRGRTPLVKEKMFSVWDAWSNWLEWGFYNTQRTELLVTSGDLEAFESSISFRWRHQEGQAWGDHVKCESWI